MGALATAAIARMDEVLPWYRAMPAENRSWVNLVAQAGVAAFVEWFRQPDAPQAISADVFGTAPRELTRSVTLQQTVELVRVVIAVVEEQIEQIAPGDEAVVREAVLRYSREIAFAAAQVYAEAAEARGAWDARLESLVVDALLRGEADDSLRSRAAALGWGSHDSVVVVVGNTPDAEPEAVVDEIRRVARAQPTSTSSPACRATGWSRSSAAHVDPVRATRAAGRAVRTRPGRGRPGRPRPARGRRERGGGRGRAAGRPGLAGRAPAGAGRRPAARAGDRRRRAGAAAAGAGDLPTAAVDGDRTGRDPGRLPRADVVAGGHRPGAVRAPQHRALPAAPGHRGLRVRARRTRGRPSTLRMALALGRLADARRPTPSL